MKVAWISHRDVKEGVGGAEGTDRDMLDRRPHGADVTLVGPGGVTGEYLDTFDRLVCTGIWGFSSRELNELGKRAFTYWPHDVQNAGHWLEEMATHLVFKNPVHKNFMLKQNPALKSKDIVLNPGALSGMEELFDGAKEDRVLWAHRLELHKGLDLAVEWAAKRGIPLDIVVNKPRETVFEAMRSAKYFILLSRIFDTGPRAILEAQLCGCEVIVSNNVGYWDTTPELLSAMLHRAADEFWELVQS